MIRIGLLGKACAEADAGPIRGGGQRGGAREKAAACRHGEVLPGFPSGVLPQASHPAARGSTRNRCLRSALPYIGPPTLTCIRRQRVSKQENENGRRDLSRRRASGVSRQGTTGLDIAKGISPSLAKRTVAMALDGVVADLADPIEQGRQDRIPDPRRPARAGTDPPRRRARDGRGGAGAVARHPGDHRPGDRQRLLLRLPPQRAVHARGPAGHRKEDARDHRQGRRLHQGGVAARGSQARVQGQGRELQGRTGRRHPAGPGPEDLPPGRLVRSLPRPAHDLDRQDRQRLQAAEGRGRLLARRQQQPDADPHLRHRVRQAGRARRLSQSARGSREARPPQARPRDGPVPLPGGRPRHGVLARQRLDHLPGDRRLHAPPPARATTAR